MSTPTPPAAPAQDPNGPGTTPEGTDENTVEYWQAQAEKWKSLSRLNESKAKDNNAKLKEYDDWKASQLTENEKAVSAARDEGYNQGRAEMAGKVAEAAFRGVATGRLADVDSVLSKLNVSQFLTESGDVDSDAITKFIDSIAPKSADSAPTPPATPGLFSAQGARPQTENLPLNGDPLLAKVQSILGIS
ncbi:hypothetical protein [Streptomyces malaysiensis]